ncbi:DUF1295-domain-containing protein [Sistotremastrum suecicum HHB10207 ss-3]|uniref:DUF1295-domain-containing protein n=1 Tax=Sistotremastrum suecicum HHB10207 ss-3 TaxID=1314776 RepID=A0A166GYL0_9AGAM|nr:DUF1295-domain-containing protein [Sistotremastrum suecicum HHB10207 ss-3]
MAWTWVASLATGNVSQVDRVWTFLPLIYTSWFTFYPTLDSAPFLYRVHGVSSRAAMMFLLQSLWMLRLSYNTWRRGLFSLSEEDYRWAILRRKVPAWLFQVINLSFIVIIQNIILFMLGLPTYRVLVEENGPLSTPDYILFSLGIVTLALEFTADNQQWSFHDFKSSGEVSGTQWPGANIQWTEHDRKRGFANRGLWAWSRHPNFACEQTFWIIQSLFPVLASNKLDPLSPDVVTPLWALVPSLTLCMLFWASTRFSESISLSKYPIEYSAYQARVAMFVPFVTPALKLYHSWRGDNERLERLIWEEPAKQD